MKEKGEKAGYTVSQLLAKMLRLLIYIYRYSLAYFLGGHCRFTPTCSAYALDALKEHGPFRGSMLAAKRVCRCNPWGGHGHDPVPRKTKHPESNLPVGTCSDT
jgi:putative membrane protein insertion efficiency factor